MVGVKVWTLWVLEVDSIPWSQSFKEKQLLLLSKSHSVQRALCCLLVTVVRKMWYLVR